MVYCSKCGSQNKDDANYCVNCRASLQINRLERRPQPRRRNWEDNLEKGAEELGRRAEEFGKRIENECFGLPQGGAIVGLIFGTFIIIIGASLAMGIDIGHVLRNTPWIGPAFIIIFGVLIVASTIYGLIRRKS